jgi:hypothetical protein
MVEFHEAIVAKASNVLPGAAFNRALESLYDTAALVYEVILPPELTWAPFRDRVYPPFVRYLQSKAFNPEAPAGVVVAVFFGDRCYLLDACEFMRLLCELDGLTPADLHARILQWLQDT